MYKISPVTNSEQLLAHSKEMPNGCIEWQRSIGSHGYGVTWYKGKLWTTHRLMAFFIYGEQPSTVHVLHSCDNRPCLNPKHLSYGTPHENMIDKWLKGRASGGSMPGEKHPMHKLTKKDVEQIRQAYGPGITTHDLAKQYGVAASTIKNIINHKSWK